MVSLSVRFRQFKILFFVYFFKIFSIFSKKKHWVIAERGCDARDNAYTFYRYIKEKHPKVKVYYLMDYSSADYLKVKADAVQYGSIKSFWLVVTANKIISTHYAMLFPNLTYKLFRACRLYNKFYFLQHGIIKDNLMILHKKNAPMELFVCGAKPEYEYVKNTFGHKESVVQYTGLARYDNLHDIKIKRQILVMPTWRQYIRTEDEFLSSSYYKNWMRFLIDESLNNLLIENNCELVFYPHFEMQKYIEHFNQNNSCIKIAKFKDYDVQTLLKESALLITDYSSVFFDFAYMKKPLLYFQFDAEDFFSKHYQKGYFDYKINGFGKVCDTSQELVLEIQSLLKNNFLIEDFYKERIEEFFPLRDRNNCLRIYEKIMEK